MSYTKTLILCQTLYYQVSCNIWVNWRQEKLNYLPIVQTKWQGWDSHVSLDSASYAFLWSYRNWMWVRVTSIVMLTWVGYRKCSTQSFAYLLWEIWAILNTVCEISVLKWWDEVNRNELVLYTSILRSPNFWKVLGYRLKFKHSNSFLLVFPSGLDISPFFSLGICQTVSARLCAHPSARMPIESK